MRLRHRSKTVTGKPSLTPSNERFRQNSLSQCSTLWW
ncbi:hypothetical protein RB5385 [Rhodopirellula baltica SH 1]|uniref:Uncharacterized protein n=1 Tax=Rhodopirellula baltica (strain DSM 10527 / NCIMB 13988 / SH1) TaxID=243090 RepID=Q7URY4_RHOBA|nr:hypothetical protein RB5385 [Rhodopirellula baltica SH 1]